MERTGICRNLSDRFLRRYFLFAEFFVRQQSKEWLPQRLNTAKSGDVSLRFLPVFMKEKERDHIATPSLTADGIFGLPLRDIFPGGQ